MKRFFNIIPIVLLSLVIATGCETSQSTPKTGKAMKDYSQYNNMVEIMQSVRGLRVRGSGPSAEVFMSGYNSVNASNKSPLFVVDGVAIGNSLSQINNLITPVQVKSVSTMRGMQATSRFGDQALFGVVLIKTIRADKAKK